LTLEVPLRFHSCDNRLNPTGTIPSVGTLRGLIDIGTNSVKLLVAEVNGHCVRPVHEVSEQTRLGRGFYETHRLLPEAIRDTADAVLHFKKIAEELRVESLKVIATSAARDAQNQAELLEAVQRLSGLVVEVISGDQEAEWVYQGVTTDPAIAGGRLLILDVGGGSSEFILGEGPHKQFQESFHMGSVRLLEQLHPADPPLPGELQACRNTIRSFISERIVPDVGRALRSSTTPCRLIGTGGASTIMGRITYQLESFERDRLEGAVLKRTDIHSLVDRLWSLSFNDRRRIIGLPKKRADVILTGAAIYEGVMEQLGFDELTISTRGIRFGGLLMR
jgi:exopolyphosphatase/guanosine-5'-triphosphate,3'-diphosphate pyrophosphatase